MSSKTEPLVSVITPCYNGRETLPWAMASLLGQTYLNWECIFVDDGSTDGSAEWVQALDDPRLRVVRFPENRGRGAARQEANQQARGQFIAMLDADDWWYSEKLEKQVAFMNQNDDVALVSAGMAIIDVNGGLVGCRNLASIERDIIKGLKDPPIAYAPSLIRAEIAQQFEYNPRLKIGQDKDFIQRLCMRHPFANVAEPLYVYAEFFSQVKNWEKIRLATKCRTIALAQFLKEYPMSACWQIARKWMAFSVKSAFFALGKYDGMIARRSNPPTPEITEQFNQEKNKLDSMLARIEQSPSATLP